MIAAMPRITCRRAVAEEAGAVNALALEASMHHFALAPGRFANPATQSAAHGPSLAEPRDDSYVCVAEAAGSMVGFVFAP